MNKTGIEWCTHSWNPMTGCLHGCPYCYARKIAERFKGSKAWPNGFTPTFHADRLDEPAALKKPAIIFAGSMTDIFGNWWKECEIYEVLEHVWQAQRHKFVILTKNPGRATDILLSHYEGEENIFSHVYFGTSVTGAQPPSSEWDDEMKRLDDLQHIHAMGFKTVISFEPLLHDPADLIKISGGLFGIKWADWIIIGGQTKPVQLPPHGAVKAILEAVPDIKPVFLKKNLGCIPVDEICVRHKDLGNHPTFPPDLLPIAQAWGKVPKE